MVTVLLPDIRGWTYAQRQECGSAGPWLSLVLLSSVSIILPRIGLSWGFIASLAPSMDLFTQGLLKGHFWPLVSFFHTAFNFVLHTMAPQSWPFYPLCPTTSASAIENEHAGKSNLIVLLCPNRPYRKTQFRNPWAEMRKQMPGKSSPHLL